MTYGSHDSTTKLLVARTFTHGMEFVALRNLSSWKIAYQEDVIAALWNFRHCGTFGSMEIETTRIVNAS